MSRPCCLKWLAFPTNRKTWPWQVVHQLGHSRVPFRDETLMEMARIDATEASELIDDALAFGWIAPYDQDGCVFVGRLPTTPRSEAS